MGKKHAKVVRNATKVIRKNRKPLLIAGICAGATVVAGVIVQGIKDMKVSAKAQHEVDKAELAAAKAEAKANLAEAKAKSRRHTQNQLMQEEYDARITEANQRITEANARIKAARDNP